MVVGYFGPEGTHTHEALISATAGLGIEPVAFGTVYDTVMAVHGGVVERALVPIENSMEGSVNATLDVLAIEATDVAIVGELVVPIEQCLIAPGPIELSEIESVVSHPQANAQCARFLRTALPRASVIASSSTAEAVRLLAEHDGRWAALGTHLAAERYGCIVLRAGVEDVPDNETRFVWLGPAGVPAGAPGESEHHIGPWKTAIVFWGAGSSKPGWLVSCLSEFAERDVNLTRIESRPRKLGLGSYMFFADLEGRDRAPEVAAALAGVMTHVDALRILGSFPAAT